MMNWMQTSGNLHMSDLRLSHTEFMLIESRYKDKTLSEVQSMQADKKKLIRSEAEETLQAKIDLARHIEAIVGDKTPPADADLKGIRQTRKREREKTHKNYIGILQERQPDYISEGGVFGRDYRTDTADQGWADSLYLCGGCNG